RHHGALQANDSPPNRAAVWETRPRGPVGHRRLVWEPANAIAMAWTPSGNEIVVTTFQYARAPDHPPMIVSPLEREVRYGLQKFRWPELELQGSCPLGLPTGWIDWVGVSPTADRVAARWSEQECGGVGPAVASAPPQTETAASH